MNEIKAFPLPVLRVLPPPGSLPATKALSLSRGEILQGTIREGIEPDRLLLRVKDVDLWAKSRVSLPPGSSVSLRVETVGPQIVLQLLSVGGKEDSAALAQLRKILGESPPLAILAEKISALGKGTLASLPGEIQKGVRELLAALGQYAPPFLTDPQTLREKILDSGVFWEGRLQALLQKKPEGGFLQASQRDLKGLLLHLKSLLQGAPAVEGEMQRGNPAVGETLQTADSYLQKIEAYQLLNQRYGDASEKWTLLLPLWFGEDLTFLEMNLGFSGEGEEPLGQEETSLLFLLEIPEMGKVKIEVGIRREALFCRFHLAAPSFRGEIQRNLPELESRLKALGFHPSLSVSEDSPKAEKEAIVTRLDENGENFVSLIV